VYKIKKKWRTAGYGASRIGRSFIWEGWCILKMGADSEISGPAGWTRA